MRGGKGYRKSRKDYPDGVIGIYDNGGVDSKHGSIDRYTVVYEPYRLDGRYEFPVTAMNGSPFHPQGFCQHMSYQFRITGSGWGGNQSVGKTINFAELPSDCQRAVRMDLEPEGATA